MSGLPGSCPWGSCEQANRLALTSAHTTLFLKVEHIIVDLLRVGFVNSDTEK